MISGYNRENIEKAKNLIDATIRQNISPIPFESHDHSAILSSSSSPSIKADPIEKFLHRSSSNETNSGQNSKKNSLKNNTQINQQNDDFSYSFSFNFNNENIQIKISDTIIGKKLQKFLNKFNFIDFIITENFDNNHDKESSFSCDRKNTIITYDRDFLLSLRESNENFINSRLMNDLQKKQECPLR